MISLYTVKNQNFKNIIYYEISLDHFLQSSFGFLFLLFLRTINYAINSLDLASLYCSSVCNMRGKTPKWSPSMWLKQIIQVNLKSHLTLNLTHLLTIMISPLVWVEPELSHSAIPYFSINEPRANHKSELDIWHHT